MHKIMIVDDEKEIIFMLSTFMEASGMEVVKAYNGYEALIKLDDSIDLVILDINMAKLSGLEVCQQIREQKNIPILFLTANATQSDKLAGFEIGADDYITKPFDPIELVARVKAHLRRYEIYGLSLSHNAKCIEFGNIQVYRSARKVLKNQMVVNLSHTEMNLLLYLIDNAQNVLTRQQILIHVWETTLYDENTVNTFIKRLRHKLEDDPSSPTYIKSVRGTGYVFDYPFS
jgi:DNA-binding response OmpR family regulator